MSDNQIKSFIAEKLNEGLSLADIQKLIDSELGIKKTFLEVRLLASEIETINWEAQDNTKTEEPTDEKTDSEDSLPTDNETASGSACVVEVNKLVKPGALLHGSVKFPSGATGDWMLDTMGRLGLDKKIGEPTQEDIEAFQIELQNVVARSGM